MFPRALAERVATPLGNLSVATNGNPWSEPPADVLQLGMAYTARFLKDLEHHGRASSSRLKVVLVGLACAGKTSFAARLEGREVLPTAEERTVGVEIRNVQLGPRHENVNRGSQEATELDVTLWDFAGQRAYYDTHQVGKVDSELSPLIGWWGNMGPTHFRVLVCGLWAFYVPARSATSQVSH